MLRVPRSGPLARTLFAAAALAATTLTVTAPSPAHAEDLFTQVVEWEVHDSFGYPINASGNTFQVTLPDSTQLTVVDNGANDEWNQAYSYFRLSTPQLGDVKICMTSHITGYYVVSYPCNTVSLQLGSKVYAPDWLTPSYRDLFWEVEDENGAHLGGTSWRVYGGRIDIDEVISDDGPFELDNGAGYFHINGLTDGDYTICEETIPAGRVAAACRNFKIELYANAMATWLDPAFIVPLKTVATPPPTNAPTPVPTIAPTPKPTATPGPTAVPTAKLTLAPGAMPGATLPPTATGSNDPAASDEPGSSADASFPDSTDPGSWTAPTAAASDGSAAAGGTHDGPASGAAGSSGDPDGGSGPWGLGLLALILAGLGLGVGYSRTRRKGQATA